MQKQTPDQAKKMLRRSLALIAVCAIVIGGTRIADSQYSPGIGFSTVQTAAADPTGPTGSPGGPGGGMNGSQFQPPGLPPQMPDYQGGNNQPPLDQNSGISIYNSGAPQAGQQAGGQQGSQQQPQQAQQPQHGTQIPDYQTATPYTQGPGRANPDYQAPQQNSPQQSQTPQQGQQQPSQAPSQTQQPSSDDQQDQEIQRQCESASQEAYPDPQILSSGGSGSLLNGPGRIGGPLSQGCIWCPKQQGPGQRFAQSRAPESIGPEPNNQCSSVGPGAFDGSSGVADLSAVQLKNASFIFSVWVISNVPMLGAKLFPDPLTQDEERLLMTEAITESGLYNFANDGTQRSHDFIDTNKQTPELMQQSFNFDWDAMGCDAGSMGMFQHNAPEYGMPAQLMDRATDTHIALYGSDSGDGGPLVESKDGLFCVTRGPEFCKVPGREAGGLSRDDVAAIWNDTSKDFATRAGAVIQWIQVSGPADYSNHVAQADQVIAALMALAHK